MKYASDFAREISPIDLEDFYGYIERRVGPDGTADIKYSTYTLDHRQRIYRGPLAPFISDRGHPTVHELVLPDDSRLAVVEYTNGITILYLYRAHITECITIEGDSSNRLNAVVLIESQIDCPIHIGPDVIFRQIP